MNSLQKVIYNSLLNSGFKPFTTSDWSVWAGSESFVSDEPLIQYTQNGEVVFIFDANGLATYYHKNGEYIGEFISFSDIQEY